MFYRQVSKHFILKFFGSCGRGVFSRVDEVAVDIKQDNNKIRTRHPEKREARVRVLQVGGWCLRSEQRADVLLYALSYVNRAGVSKDVCDVMTAYGDSKVRIMGYSNSSFVLCSDLGLCIFFSDL